MSRLEKLLGIKRTTLKDVIASVHELGSRKKETFGWLRREIDPFKDHYSRCTNKHVYKEVFNFFKMNGIHLQILDKKQEPILVDENGFLTKPVSKTSKVLLYSTRS